MGAIADLSDLVNRLTGGNSGTPETIFFHKTPRAAGTAVTAPVAGRLHSMWLQDGQPAAGIAPTTAAIPDNTTAGGLLQTDPGGGRTKYLQGLGVSNVGQGTLILYDRLLHIGSMSGTTTSTQAVQASGSPALTRYTNGVGNFAFAEIYTAVGATGTTIKLSSYTNQAGTGSRAGQLTTFGGTGFSAAGRAVMLPLAAGDTGIQGVASVQVTATTGTAGAFGVTVGHVIAVVDCSQIGAPGIRSFAQGLPGMPVINTDACLAWLYFPNGTTIPEILGAAQFVEA